jgi:hypothetical protein
MELSKKPENLKRKLAVGALVAGIALPGVVGLGNVVAGKGKKETPFSFVDNGRTIPTQSIIERAKQSADKFSAPGRPFPGVGGGNLKGPWEGPADFQRKETENSDKEYVEQLRKSYNVKFEQAVELDNGLTINVYGNDENSPQKLKINPEGISQLFNTVIDTIPYMRPSRYKDLAMKFYRKAQSKQLSDTQINLFLAAAPDSCITDADTFGFKGQSGKKSICLAIGEEMGSIGGPLGIKRRSHNFVLAIGGPESGGTNFDKTAHEFGHAIIAAADTDKDNLVDDADTWGVDKGSTNAEHELFVVPLGADAGFTYSQGINSGAFQPAYEYVGK